MGRNADVEIFLAIMAILGISWLVSHNSVISISNVKLSNFDSANDDIEINNLKIGCSLKIGISSKNIKIK